MKKMSLIKNIAKGVGVAGTVGIVVVAPNATVALDKLAKMYNKKSKDSYKDYLKRSGYFSLEQKGDSFVIRLSEKGSESLIGTELEDYEFETGKEWDGAWHLLMFDIPETSKNVRDNIQYRIKQIGMRQVQNSVYVHYRPTKELAKIIRQTYPAVSSLVISASVKRIDGEAQLKHAFKLT